MQVARATPRQNTSARAFSLAHDVFKLETEVGVGLFSTRTQQIHSLNGTAALIWSELVKGKDVAGIAHALESAGCSPNDAEPFVRSSISSWQAIGYVTPREVVDGLYGLPLHVRAIELAGMAFVIQVFAPIGLARAELASAARILSAFDQAFSQIATAPSRIQGDKEHHAVMLVAHEGLLFVLLEGVCQCAIDEADLVPTLKALFTRVAVNSLEDAFFAHAAQISREDKTILLCGLSGAGKTTLALALASRGFDYMGDDIVCIGPDGMSEGLALPASVKEGAWDLLRPHYPEIDQLAVYARADGKRVRYLSPPRSKPSAPRIPNVVLFLNRWTSEGAAFDEVGALDAACLFLEGAYARSGKIDGASLAKLTVHFDRAYCARLHYRSLSDALEAMNGLTA